MKLLPLILLCVLSTGAFLRSVAQDTGNAKSDNKFILGNIEVIHSEILSEDRILNVYLPQDYDSTARYPIIYLLDGSADEDFIHIAGIVQFNTFPWVNRMPKSIVIGIANNNRKYDFTSKSERSQDNQLVPKNGGSTRFITFIEKELQPYINGKYGKSTSNTIIGQSLGGLLATEILFSQPQLFDNYVIISPSLWWRDGYLLKSKPSVLDPSNSAATKIYIGVGKEGSIDGSKEHIMEEDARKLADKLRKGGARHVKVFFDYLPEEDHGTITHQAVLNAFRKLNPKQN